MNDPNAIDMRGMTAPQLDMIANSTYHLGIRQLVREARETGWLRMDDIDQAAPDIATVIAWLDTYELNAGEMMRWHKQACDAMEAYYLDTNEVA